jgi:hypothetical protein
MVIMERILMDSFINSNLKEITIFKKNCIYTIYEDGIKIGSVSDKNRAKGLSKMELRRIANIMYRK